MSRSGKIALMVVLGVVFSAADAVADPEVSYVPEFTCAVSMSTPGEPARSCAEPIPAGEWHLDLDAAFVLDGAFVLRVEAFDGKADQVACTRETDGLSSSTRCTSTHAHAEESGGGTGFATADTYMHIDLPVVAVVTLVGGEGAGVVIVRGARV